MLKINFLHPIEESKNEGENDSPTKLKDDDERANSIEDQFSDIKTRKASKTMARKGSEDEEFRNKMR
jgi:hypothetical protein